MDIRALLFDINGTLIDIETNEGLDEIYRTIAHFLTYQGISLHRGEVRDLYFQLMQQQRETSQETYAEWDAVELWREILQRNASDYTCSLPAEKLQQLPLFLAELHRGIARKRLRLYPGVQEVLDQLRLHYLMAIVSDAQSAYAVPELHAVGLLGYFNPVIISGDYGYRKPDIRLFQQALDALQVQPEQALFIGNDMHRDVFGPQQLKMKTIFLSSNQGEKYYQGVQPDYIIYHFAELPQAINFFSSTIEDKGDTMQRRSLLLTAPRQLAWVVEDLPPLQPNEVLVQTRAGAISIGSELPQYCGTARSSTPASYPRMTGYESVGTIIACGSAVRRLRVGDRVVAFYGHRTHGIVPEARAIVVPKGVSDALALLVILTCEASKGIRKVDIEPASSVLITGAGTIGLLTLFMIKRYEGDDIAIDVVEPHAERRALALRLGARTTLSPQEMIKRNDTYTHAFECSSRNAAFELLQSKMQREGRICILADGNIEPFILTPTFHEKELQIIGSSDGWDYQEHAKWYFDVVRKDSYDLEQIFDCHTTADDLIATFERIATGAITPTKVLVQYDTPQS